MVLTTADVIETFIYRVGIRQARFDFTTAAGLFNGLVGMVLVLLADRLAKTPRPARHLLTPPPLPSTYLLSHLLPLTSDH